MPFSNIDWAILISSLFLLTGLACWTFRYMQGVADFLAANRSGGRYMVSVARGMSSYGAVSLVATMEAYYVAGFPPIWWQLMKVPVSVVIVLSGWVYYRFRESRSFTLAQFYEKRYSKFTRIYAGIVAWVSGIVNFGIFPAVAARFFIYFCDLGSYPVSWGPMQLDLVFAGVMLSTLAIALLYTCLGGQITVMVTDCVQGVFTNVLFVMLGIYLLYRFAWGDITEALLTAPAGESMVNPYDTAKVTSFNVWFYLIDIFGAFYVFGNWQGSQAYDTSALSPHEQKMGNIISVWRTVPQTLLTILIPICIFAFLHVDAHSTQAVAIQEQIATIDNDKIAAQMTVPLALSQVLPVGLKGLFCVAMLFFLITTQDTYLHSWGSIFVQDVILPFRRQPFTPRQHVLLLRLSIIGVALFAFLFSLLFKQEQYILMFFAITGAIISGAGAMLVGGLYWNRGTAAGACTALTVGWIVPVAKLINGQVLAYGFADVPAAEHGALLKLAYRINDINDQYIWFWTMMACIGSYVLVSLLTSQKRFDLDRVLNRGEFAIAGEHTEMGDAPESLWLKICGITREFTRTDRWLAFGSIGWNFGWFGVFLVATFYNFFVATISNGFWIVFWKYWIWTNLVISVPIAVWFAIGATVDIRNLFVRLEHFQRDDADMGMVSASEDEARE